MIEYFYNKQNIISSVIENNRFEKLFQNIYELLIF